MGRVALVEFNDVAMIANKMMAEGKKPSAREIQKELGFGSMSTVQAHFKQWRADQALHLPAINHEILSPDINRAINLTIATQVSAVTIALTETLADEIQNYLQIKKEFDALSEAHKTQAAEFTEMKSMYEKQTGYAEALELEATMKIKELTNERQAAELARTALTVAEHKLERMQLLEVDVDQLRSDLKQANDKIAEFSKAAWLKLN
jgi:SOS-response transcriptional repressor LexA